MDREIIVRALDETRVLSLTYGEGGTRFVQPHAIVRKADGSEMLEAYQVRGFSESDTEHGWKHFDLARISGAEVLTERFEPRRDFRPVSSQSSQVLVKVREDEALGLGTQD